ncbi:MAG: hypothetical protein ISR64_03340 [Deltaproteobacteria bacterium]|nr:hypothetical protein [Deltaproteobacteria bacterium]
MSFFGIGLHSGYCSSLCETAADCPDVESGGTSFQGICVWVAVQLGGGLSMV